MPELGQKKDAIPGFINELWTRVEEPGVYRGQCAELCGKDHGFMPIVVRAAPEEEYRAWVAEQKTAQAEQAALAMRTLEQAGADGVRREGLRHVLRDVPPARWIGRRRVPFPPFAEARW